MIRPPGTLRDRGVCARCKNDKYGCSLTRSADSSTTFLPLPIAKTPSGSSERPARSGAVSQPAVISSSALPAVAPSSRGTALTLDERIDAALAGFPEHVLAVINDIRLRKDPPRALRSTRDAFDIRRRSCETEAIGIRHEIRTATDIVQALDVLIKEMDSDPESDPDDIEQYLDPALRLAHSSGKGKGKGKGKAKKEQR
jgi:hypothetical protein